MGNFNFAVNFSELQILSILFKHSINKIINRNVR